MEAWKPREKNEEAGIAWWNGNAEKFSEMELPTVENSIGMRIIEREKMVKNSCTVLDVGCGGGRFAFALEALGAEVTATDFSPRMISEAQKQQIKRNSRVKFSVDNWHTLNLAQKNWEDKFDLVLANMTPAVISADTFLKLSDASRNWVLMVKPTRRTNSILDELNKLVGADRDTESLDETLAYAFDLLWFKGYCPRLEYEEEVWKNDLPLEEAIEEYSLRIASVHDLSAENESTIQTYLKRVAVDGIVHETTNTTIAAMYWQVRPTKNQTKELRL
jgi:2-polyprenyl-3-methyl-5-hydroxy-6-metoxy-1,4-benzoquinol methylase